MQTYLQIIITYFVIIISASAEGINHALLWSDRSITFRFNEHKLFLLQRLVFVVALLITAHWIGFIAGLLSYAYFHNGFYCMYRSKIDGSYINGFDSYSKGVRSEIDFRLDWRAVLLIAGIAILLTGILLSTRGKL